MMNILFTVAGSCNFENFEMCHYQMETNESILSWKLVNAGDFSNALPTDNTINSTGQGMCVISLFCLQDSFIKCFVKHNMYM